LLLSGDYWQVYVGGISRLMIDRLHRWNTVSILSYRITRIHIAVEMREVTTRYIDADTRNGFPHYLALKANGT
jgi:hypothetical protein